MVRVTRESLAKNGVDVSVTMNDPHDVNASLNGAVKNEVILEAMYAPSSDVCGLGIFKPAQMSNLGVSRQELERFFGRIEESQGRLETVLRNVVGDPYEIAPDFRLSGDVRHPCSE